MLLDILFPRLCLGCQRVGSYLCVSCSRQVKIVKRQSCPYCQKVSELGLVHDECRRPNEIDALISSFYYNAISKRIIAQLKYKLVYNAFSFILSTIPDEHIYKLSSLRNESKELCLQPIPLHAKRFRRRGYNQAEIITDFLVNQTQFLKVGLLKRVKHTPPLARTKSRLERNRFIHGAFKTIVETSLANQAVCLVDDVYTSGSTVKEAARTLKAAGAKSVYVYTLARG